jgi:hypothetical protein
MVLKWIRVVGSNSATTCNLRKDTSKETTNISKKGVIFGRNDLNI